MKKRKKVNVNKFILITSSPGKNIDKIKVIYGGKNVWRWSPTLVFNEKERSHLNLFLLCILTNLYLGERDIYEEFNGVKEGGSKGAL